MPMAQIKELMGHYSIVMTERYIVQTSEDLKSAAKCLDDGGTFDPTSPPVSAAKFQVSCKIASDHRPGIVEIDDDAECNNSLEVSELPPLESWLGRRDSNPNKQSQSLLSYR